MARSLPTLRINPVIGYSFIQTQFYDSEGLLRRIEKRSVSLSPLSYGAKRICTELLLGALNLFQRRGLRLQKDLILSNKLPWL